MYRPVADDTKLLALGRAVRELRARIHVSQEELGFRAQMHRNRVGAIERGEANLTFLALLRLVMALRVPLDEFAAVWARQHAGMRTEAAQHRPRL